MSAASAASPAAHARIPVVRIAVVIGVGVWLASLAMLWSQGTSGALPTVAALVVAGYSAMSAIATWASWSSSRATTGVDQRTWRMVAVGLALWTCGGLAYLIFLATGGDILQPAAWSQAGYLAAYPLWYLALWQLRQPVLSPTRKRQVETVLIEIAVLGMFAAVIGGVLWYDQWPVSHNVAQLVPAVLDILLLASFYAAVRRSNWSANAALTWLGYAFAALATSDLLMTYFAARNVLWVGGIAFTGYLAAMTLIVIASRRPLRVAEAQNRLRSTTGTVAITGLTLAGIAATVVPSALEPVVIAVAILLAWRTVSVINEKENSDTDVLTGFLERKAFERHLGGVVQQSTIDRPSLLVAIDLTGFGAWNARNGYSEGDALLLRVSKALEGAGLTATAWGRLDADRFAITTPSTGDLEDRALAEHLRLQASAAAEPLEARAALVRLPLDAHGPAEALDALDEALRAGSEAGRAVVAYDSGTMDGISATPGNASLLSRRERIQEIIATPTSIMVFLQPIARLADMSIHGFEALSRFNVDPRLRPDQWITEATRVGLGTDLEVECAERAWNWRADLPATTHLAINVSPDTILDEEFTRIFADGDLDGLVLEITEHERVSNYPRLAARLAALRGRGARVAIDDTGAGHASLNHLLELKPDYIKLDRKFISGLDLDAGKHALVRNMLHLADDLGATLIAEGIETEGELWALRELGVPLGQGYFLGKPAPSVAHNVSKTQLSPFDSRIDHQLA